MVSILRRTFYVIWMGLFFWGSQSSAAIFAEIDGIYTSDTFTTATDATYKKTFYSFDLFANLTSKYTVFAGFHLDQINFSEQPTASTEYSLTSQNMGVMLMWVMDKAGTYSLSAGYNLVQKGSYTTTGASETTLDGTGYWGTFGIMPEVAENLYLGVKFLYYQASYSKKLVGTTSSDVSYSRSFISPILGLSFRYH